MRTMRFFVAALLLLPGAAGAQATTDSKWSNWLGCWELVLESSRDGVPNLGQPGRGSTTPPRSASRPQVCVQPAPGGATFSTRVGAQTPIEQTVIADGADHPIVDADCTGTQRAEWSQDGLRLFADASLTCSNDKGRRRVSGIAILGPNGTWVDIQSVDISGQVSVRVRRYRRVDGSMTSVTARPQGLTLEDVKEASSKVSSRALEAALVETGSSFDLSGKRLIALQDAGVPAAVIDLMVALSYPDRFVVERMSRVDFAPIVPVFDDPFLVGWAFGYPMWSDAYGFYSPLYVGGGSIIVIGDGGSSPSPGRPSGSGRVVDGLGYTRVRPRDAEGAPTPRDRPASSTSDAGSSGTGSSSSSGGGSSVSTEGFSSGGSGGDGGRTAQPR